MHTGKETRPEPPEGGQPPSATKAQQGMGTGMRMATDMVVATLIGVAMGYYLDQWLATQPWLTVIFFFLGAASGFRMVYQLATQKKEQQPSVMD